MDKRKFKPVSIAHLYKTGIEMEFEQLKEFLNEVSSNLESKRTEFEEKYNKIKDSDLADEDHLDYISSEFSWKYYEVYPKYTYNPLLLSIYGFFENWLKKTCDIYKRKGFSNLTVNDFAGRNYIEKSKLFFEKVVGIGLSDMEELWNRIKEIQNIRNLIAHHESNVIKNPNRRVSEQSFFKLIKDQEYIEFNEGTGDFFISRPEFLFDTMEIMQKYLFEVLNRIANVNVIAKNSVSPYDMASWGNEKMEGILIQIIQGLNLIDNYENQSDPFDESILANLRAKLASMTFNATKIYSFFKGGQWDVKDKDLIISNRLEGLEELKKLYEN